MWGIDRKSGESGESLLSSFTFKDVSINQSLKVNRLSFIVIEINEDYLILQANNKDLKVPINTVITYRPRSFDAGHYYRIKATK